MSPNNSNTSTFTDGQVSGAASSLYSSETTNIDVTYSAAIGETVGRAGGYQHDNFRPTDINVVGFEGKAPSKFESYVPDARPYADPPSLEPSADVGLYVETNTGLNGRSGSNKISSRPYVE